MATASALIKATPGQKATAKGRGRGQGGSVGREVVPNADAAHNIAPQCNAIQHCAALMTAVLVFWQRCQAGGGGCISHCTASFTASFSPSLSSSRTLTNVWIYNCFILWPGPVTSTDAAHATLEMHWVRMALAAQCAKWALQGRFIYTEIHAHTVRTHTHIKIFHLSTIAICWLLMPKTLVFIFISRANVCRVNSNRFMKAIR